MHQAMMYSPIPEVALLETEVEGEATNPSVARRCPLELEETKLLYLRRVLWRGFVASFGLSCLVFGIYICSFYLQSILRNDLDVWDATAPGLYRKDHWDSSLAIGAHFVGGAYLMLLGPLQFFPVLRRKYMTFHRWNGRFALVGAMLTAFGGIGYICSVGSANVAVVGQSANWNNLLFGVSMFICGVQTYRHAAITKRIDQHKLWAYRLAGLGLGSIFVRMGQWGVILLLSIDASNQEELARSTIYKISFDFFIYTNYLPFILLATEVWKYEQREASTTTPKVLFLGSVALLLALFVLGVAMLMKVAWIPFIGHSIDYYKDDSLVTG